MSELQSLRKKSLWTAGNRPYQKDQNSIQNGASQSRQNGGMEHYVSLAGWFPKSGVSLGRWSEHTGHAIADVSFTFPIALAEIRLRSSLICGSLIDAFGSNRILPLAVPNRKRRWDS
jgi:hypothetical protein